MEQNNILIRTFCVGFTPLLIPVTWLELTNKMFPLSMPKGIQRSTAVMPQCFTLRANPMIPVKKKAGWAPKQVWMLWRSETSLAPAGN
jgi:hypothetical protein